MSPPATLPRTFPPRAPARRRGSVARAALGLTAAALVSLASAGPPVGDVGHAALPDVELAPSAARADDGIPKELEGIDIVPKPGAQLPRDLLLQDQSGKQVRLGDYLDGKPIVLQLAYFDCPMLCTQVLNGLLDGLKGIDWTAGKEFRVLVVSFDPRDKAKAAADKRATYLQAYGRSVSDGGFEFLVGTEDNVRRLADTVGFRYRWDEPSREYAHAAGAFFFTHDGRLSRVLYGLDFPAKNVHLALVEASQGKLGTAWDRVLLWCFHYDPKEKAYVLATQRVMKAGGALTLVGLGLMLRRLWRSEKKRAAPPAGSPSASTDSGPTDPGPTDPGPDEPKAPRALGTADPQPLS
jgi:protein SCO1/2